ncbi:lipocalin-like domain-containing protein [Larkinella soli]|uniref:lipocalin family protein n=1 Tax=Larkinella soli TaxID=1770527 RepID=UPI001E6195F9|nr:lipocalin family protein [Larkinella soli]
MKTKSVLMNVVQFRFSWTLVMLMALSVWFTGCKKDSDGDGDPDVKPSAIEGSWKISGMKTSTPIDLGNGTKTSDLFVLFQAIPGGEGTKMIACLTDIKIIFNGNGTVTGVDSPKCQSADVDDYNPAGNNSKWKVEGNKVTITDGDGTSTVYDAEFSGSTMKWSSPMDDIDGDGKDDTITIEFKKA